MILAIICAVSVTSCASDDPLDAWAPTTTTEPVVTTTIRPTTTTTTTTTTTSTTSTTSTTTTTTRPVIVRSTPTAFDDVPGPILERIQNLWPEDQWDRALSVAWCESRFRVDAANPTSSARGVFQLLAPWRRDPGSGRTVWGYDYTAAGEKLSAAAGIGITESDATSTLANIDVAHLIWQNEGWVPWAASQHCWAE